MRTHHSPTVLLAKLDGSDGLRDTSNLIDFQEEGIASLFVNGILHTLDVSNCEIVANDLCGLSDILGHGRPRLPIILVKWILDGEHRVVLAEVLVKFQEFLACLLQGWVTLLTLWVPCAKVIAIL